VTFNFPETINLCAKEYYGEYAEDNDEGGESIEGVFD
jgi:hypothetical protein